MKRNLRSQPPPSTWRWLLMLSLFAGCDGASESMTSTSNQHGGAGGSVGTSTTSESSTSGFPSSPESSHSTSSGAGGAPADIGPDAPDPDPPPPLTAIPTTPLAPPVPTAPMDAGMPEPPGPAPTSPLDAGSPQREGDDEWQLDWMDDPTDNPSLCPVDEPMVGDPCPSYELVCKYGETTNCRSRWVCGQDDSWYMQYAKRDCPDVCPADEPSEGDPCTSDKAQCTYGPDPTCRSQWMCFESQWTLTFPARDCAAENNCPQEPPRVGVDCDPFTQENGCIYETAYSCGCSCAWDEEAMASGVPTTRWYCRTIDSSLPPDYLRSCPQQVPTDGTTCDTSSTCGYQTLDECTGPGEGTTLAQCVDGVWSVQPPPATF